MADFVGLATRQHNTKRLKRALAQTFPNLCKAHINSVSRKKQTFQPPDYAADCKMERLGWAARLLSD